eukprot:m.168641 g.168641  ORF g.168641 m.168641 type:complete len:721 (-) comp17792_c0_seq6:54-2216(-)
MHRRAREWSRRLRCVKAEPDSVVSAGDKVQLPASCLTELGDKLNKDTPLLLKFVVRLTGGPKVHGSVLDFSAPEGSVVCPAWMLEALEVSDGFSVTVSETVLPLAESVALQPVTTALFAAHDARAVLQAALSAHYVTLTKGTVVEVHHVGARYRIRVLEVEPEEAVSIFNTDIEVDLRPAVDEQGNMLPLPTQGPSGAGGAPAAAGSSGASDSAKPLEVVLGDATGTPISATGAAYSLFRLQVPENTAFAVNVKMTGETGDVECYLAAQDGPPVTREQHLFTSNEGDGLRGCSINVGADHGVKASDGFCVFALALRAYDSDHCDCVVTLSAKQSNQHPQGDGAAAAVASSVCPNCREQVPEQHMVRHMAFCTRNNQFCEFCSKVVRKADIDSHWHCEVCWPVMRFATSSEAARAKHNVIEHTLLTCVCGEKFERREMMQHRSARCPERAVVCRFCKNKMRAGEPAREPRDRLRGMTQHESDCGGRTEKCMQCSASVRLKDMEVHLQLHRLDEAATVQGRDQPMASSSHPSSATASPALPRANGVPDVAMPPASSDFFKPVEPKPKPSVKPLCACLGCIGISSPAKGLCQACHNKLLGSEVREVDAQTFLTSAIQHYFKQLTQGCGDSECDNKLCAVQNKLQPNEAGAKSLELAKKAVAKPPELFLCLSREQRERHEQAVALSEMGFDLEWVALALAECTEGGSSAAAAWLLNHAPPATSA